MSPVSPAELSRAEQGYVLLGIAIGLVILGISMAAAVPAWDYVIQREKETELLWRGRQYVQAIERYQRQYPGAFPANVDVLVEEKFLRKAYEDPMTADGEWRILRQNSPELQGITAPGEQDLPGRAAGRDPRFRAAERFARPSELGRRRTSEQALGGIVGVASASEKSTLRIPGQEEAAFLRTVGEGEQYDQWLFVFQVGPDPSQQPQGGAPGVPEVPGVPGRRPPGQGGPPGGFDAPNRQNPPGARQP